MHRRMKPAGGQAQWQRGRKGWAEIAPGQFVRENSKKHRDHVKRIKAEEAAEREAVRNTGQLGAVTPPGGPDATGDTSGV